jgi:hypothetical protein
VSALSGLGAGLAVGLELPGRLDRIEADAAETMAATRQAAREAADAAAAVQTAALLLAVLLGMLIADRVLGSILRAPA